MTVIVDVTFPFGYVHATPWGTHVNEGAVEWPPSPWRLLRGLAATWFTRHPELAPEAVVPVLAALATAPAVRAAPRTETSIRSYLPSEADRSGALDRDLVIDAFAAVEPGTGVSYRWATDIDLDQQRILDALVADLPYLGRAESVCASSARYEDDDGAWLDPLDDRSGIGTRVLTPSEPLDLDALCTSIRVMRKGGRLVPPGSRWIRYPVDAPVVDRSRPARRRPTATVHAVRFGISATAPLSIRHALAVGETMRRAAMSQFGSLNGGRTSTTFAGKDANGDPLRGRHGHAHWLPADLDGDRLIDTVIAWSPDGFGEAELRALAAIRRLHFKHDRDGTGSVQVVSVGLEAMGQPNALGLREMVGPARTWRSATPFVPQLHHHRDRESFEDYIAKCAARELVARGITASLVSIEPERSTSWGSFRRQRRGEGLRRARSAYGFTLEFAEPIPGPLCLGALSHFGLGRFEACPT